MITIADSELNNMLQPAFNASTRLYLERSFQHRNGFGNRLSLVNVGLADAWMRSGYLFTLDQDKMDNEIMFSKQ
ncbi:hypothetical protein [Sneathiella sp.]|uniref:hypothetical protein n=1 Tax=Sneathiella sp. TaxID=1964365 RepID=UPI003568BAEC